MADTRFFTLARAGDVVRFSLTGDRTLENIVALERLLDWRLLGALQIGRVAFQCGELREFNLAGAWLLYRTGERLRQSGYAIEIDGLREEHLKFIEDVLDIDVSCRQPPARIPLSQRLHDDTARAWQVISGGLAQRLEWWLLVARTALGTPLHPRSLRWVAAVRHINDVGISAIGIVGQPFSNKPTMNGLLTFKMFAAS